MKPLLCGGFFLFHCIDKSRSLFSFEITLTRNFNVIKSITVSILLACALPLSAFAQSQGVSISPVTLTAPLEARSQAVKLTNAGDKPIRYQIDAYHWAQVNGQHVHSVTADILAAPAIVEIPPKGSRVVRAMRVSGQGTAYYRLMIRELPEAAEEGSSVRMPLNHNLPLAFEPSSSTLPPLTAQAQAGGYLLTNSGTVAARVSSIGPSGAQPWRKGALGWVLPGSSLLIGVGPQQRSAALSLTVNGEPVTVSTGQ